MKVWVKTWGTKRNNNVPHRFHWKDMEGFPLKIPSVFLWKNQKIRWKPSNLSNLTMGFCWSNPTLKKHWLKIGSQTRPPNGKNHQPSGKSMNLLNQESTPKNTNAYAEKKDLSIWTRQCVGNLHPEDAEVDSLIGLDEDFETPYLPYLPYWWHLKTTASLLTKWHTNSKDTLY